MSDVGKAIYLACSALLFIFAATASIYLYTTLNTYLDDAIFLTNVYDRAEGQKELDVGEERKVEKRKIGASEVLITITNMEQMHINAVVVKVNNTTINFSAADDGEKEIAAKIKKLGTITSKNFSYSYSSETKTVTYTGWYI